MVMAETFRMIGYPPTKVRYLVNRADSTGGIDPEDLQPRPRAASPSTTSCSDGALVVPANNQGVPFVLADPTRADQPGRHADGGRAASGAGRRRGGAPVAGRA